MTGPYRLTLTSPFPRPETLVRATRDLDRGRTTPERAEEAFASAEAEVRRLEVDLRLDSVTGGYLRWPDLFRPFTQLWSGARAGPLTRFFETNTFYRQPILDAPPRPGRGHLSDWLPKGRTARALLPGPYTLAALAEARYASGPDTSVLRDVAAALSASIRDLGADRPGYFQFQEPMLAYAPPPRDRAGLLDAYRELATACAGTTTAVWTYFGDGGPALAALAPLPVDILGLDLLSSRLPAGVRLAGKALGVGCLDPTTTLPEDLATVGQLVRSAEAALAPSGVWLGPNPPLDLLPFDSAVTKLQLLPRLREELTR